MHLLLIITDECYSQYIVAQNYGGLTHPSQELLAAVKLAEYVYGTQHYILNVI